MKLKDIYKRIKVTILNSYYSYYYYNIELNKKLILVESKSGGDLAGNMFHILLELSKPEYEDYNVYLSVLESKFVSIQNQLDKYSIKNVKMIRTNSYNYYKYLAMAKYLFTDTAFNRSYVKKEGQIITNTWHGTPLKKMGRDVDDRAYAIGNVQRNLLFADYLIYPNDYMKEKMIDAYMLKNLYDGTILNEGYPRNSVFFHKEIGEDIKRELGLEDKQVFIYMPTWRGTLVKKNTEHLLAVTEYQLRPLDKELKDNQVLYVKLHPFVSKDVDYSKYEHIKPYPDQYDTYEFMNMCDCLITDYSSVFYDFANTRKKIILFAYDETEYLRERGLYVPLNSLPFPVVKSVKDLVYELNSPKNYDDTQFLNECCTYDSPGAAGRICKHVIKGEKECREEKLPKNGKDIVIIFDSALAKNGLTTSLLNLFNNIDLKKRNYIVTFNEQALRKAPLRVAQIPEEVDIYPMSSGESFTLLEAIAYILYFKLNKENGFTEKYLERLYKREWKKQFGVVHFDYAIQFAGYEKKVINLFQRFEGHKSIYVHSDMVAEMKTRDNQHYLTLKNAYQKYDKVAVITRDIVPPTLEISGREDNIVVVSNCHAHKEVICKSKEPLAFDADTKCNITEQELKEILATDKKKFITIGRFSPEKGHMMLMKAFEKFSAKYRDVYLIIIGGHGVLYNQTLEYANNSEENIIIIKSIKNPMPVLKQCNFFILSSYYEGLGLTLLEADALGIPTMSTDIPGPQGFVRDHGGYLVEASEDGLEKGMIAFMKGVVKAMNVDYDKYNRKAVEQFDSLFK
ncbi:CDP-glycerol glycerophosphotransferase family protein [Anaerocolumna xylanovorans]|uniref:CDP-glycerol glycerophosphotransferase n=1 Tax=Anaerocolumna xylanovorans DSM 12503 TaxID=1121345 RepID=A0A1M7YI88_9FIRM|nr:CDP-glycerol glycerophosphotransferase family protein [Anaerocolumna xylanovorans]SHO52354.1 CDP-glycerol glycerophosphotransferase [Anaerocolumna xylanovorans DSM 12503]